MNVGNKLKEARIAKGLTLENLEETTKIQKRYLAAIEEGNLHILPGKFYARAFIKEYANAVGINPDEILEEHKEEIPQSEDESEIPYTRMERSRRRNNYRSGVIFTFMPKVIVGLLIIGILVTAIFFYGQSRSNNAQSETDEPETNVIITNPNGNLASSRNNNNEAGNNEETESDETDEESKEESEKTMEFEIIETGTGAAPTSTIAITKPDDELIFTFETGSSVWLDVMNKDGDTFYNTFVDTANSPLELDLSGERSIHLNIGSTPNLDIQINGVDLEYPVDPNERDHQRIWIQVEQGTEV